MGSKRQRKQAKRKRKREKRDKRDATRSGGGSERAAPVGDPDAAGRGGPFEEPFDRLEAVRRGVEDARGDLRRDPDDAEALIRLAESAAAGPSEQVALLEQALAASERRLRRSEGEDVFERLRGLFWGVLETRGYMRARLSLAQGVLRQGRVAEALDHFEAMLELCPGDNLLVRPYLASTALELGRHDLAERVCDRFADEPLCWVPWTRALLEFARRGAEDARARELLERACEVNPYVVDHLVGVLPLVDPVSFQLGSRSEAAWYAVGAERAWAHVPGALRWLHAEREVTGASVPRALLSRKDAAGLGRLPQTGGTWHVGGREMPGWLEAEQAQPWATVVVSEVGLVLACDVTVRAPSAAEVWATCRAAMSRPAAGRPSRPAALAVDWEVVRTLAGPGHAIGVDVVARGDDRPLAACLSALATEMRGGMETAFPAWTMRPGVSEARVTGLCDAAAAFYRRTPWQRVDDREGFVLTPAPGDAAARRLFGGARPCGVVMGAAGETYGLALYESLDTARVASDGSSPRDSLPSTTVTFDPPGLHHDQDLERFRQFGCALPGREALPLVFRMEEGDDLPVAPTPTQLGRLEAALRLIPAVVEQGVAGATVPAALGSEGQVRVEVERVVLHPDDPAWAGDEPLTALPAGLEAVDPDLEDALDEITWWLEEFFAARPYLGPPDPCLAAAVLLCSVPDSPVHSGYPRSWAGGVAHAWLRASGVLGRAILAADVAEAFEVSRNTATSKARQVDDALKGLIEAAVRASR